VSFEVGDLVAPISPRLVCELENDARSRRSGLVTVVVDVVDVNVEHGADVCAGTAAVDRWQTKSDKAVADFHLGALDTAV